MDLDQHTRHVTEALDKRLRDNWKPRRFSDLTARQRAANELVTEIRHLTGQLLAEQQRIVDNVGDALTEERELNAAMRVDLAIAQATATQEAKTVKERDWLIASLQKQLLALHRTPDLKVPEWSEAAREPATTPAPEGRSTP